MEQKRKPKSRLVRLLQYDVNLGKYKQLLFENLVLMVTSGINLVTALEQFKKESQIKALAEILDNMIGEIRSGQPFWQTLAHYEIVKGNMLDIIRIGEESGNLADNLETVLIQQRKDQEIRAKLFTASLYPMILLLVMIVVGSMITIYVLPSLTQVYRSFKTELPLLTTLMIQFGDFMGIYGKVLIPTLITAMATSTYFLFYFSRTKWIGQRMLLNIPIIKSALIQLEMTRLGYLLNSLLKSGFKVVDSIDIIAKSTDLVDYKNLYIFLGDSLASGDSFSQSFDRFPRARILLPIYARQAIISGEQSGKLNMAFKQIGDTFQKEYDYTTANLYVLMEPVLLILVWIGVFVMALAVILPIYSLMGSFSDISGGSAQNVGTVQITATPLPILPKIELISDGVQAIPIYTIKNGGIKMYAQEGEIYEYSTKDDNWYEILLKDGSIGFVQQRFAREVENVTVTSILK